MPKQLRRYSFFAIIVVLSLASFFPLLAAYHNHTFLNDDTYITLTFSKNLLDGRGFVFNYPPSVLGTTSPLFTILVAGLSFILHQSNIKLVAVLFTTVCWSGIAWVFFLFRKEWGLKDWQALILGLVVIGSGWINILGMEAYLFEFLLVLCLSLFLGKRYFFTGVFTGILFLTRGEGILLLGVIFITGIIHQFRDRRTFDRPFFIKNLRMLSGFAIPVLVWFLYANATFNSILPNTLAAKQAQLQDGLWLSFWQCLTEQWMPSWGTAFTLNVFPGINFWWVIVVTGIGAALFQKQKWLIFAGWITLYISGYLLLGVAGYWWYQLPIVFVLDIFFGIGVVALIEIIRRTVKPFRLSMGISVLLGCILIFSLVKPAVDTMAAYSGDPRGTSYTVLTRWFRDHTDRSKSIAFIEIGYLGYYTDNRIIDLAGLILPDIVPHVANKDFGWGFWHYLPDYYVYLPDFDWALASIKADPRFDQQYTPVATLAGPRESNFTIYQRIQPGPTASP